jgi:hypothetical protein
MAKVKYRAPGSPESTFGLDVERGAQTSSLGPKSASQKFHSAAPRRRGRAVELWICGRPADPPCGRCAQG